MRKSFGFVILFAKTGVRWKRLSKHRLKESLVHMLPVFWLYHLMALLTPIQWLYFSLSQWLYTTILQVFSLFPHTKMADKGTAARYCHKCRHRRWRLPSRISDRSSSKWWGVKYELAQNEHLRERHRWRETSWSSSLQRWHFLDKAYFTLITRCTASANRIQWPSACCGGKSMNGHFWRFILLEMKPVFIQRRAHSCPLSKQEDIVPQNEWLKYIKYKISWAKATMRSTSSIFLLLTFCICIFLPSHEAEGYL